MLSPLLTTRRERGAALRLGGGGLFRRLLDEASPAGAAAAPRPIGGFADDEASTACARCRLSRRYGGRCRLLDKRVVAGFSAPRDASPR